jgi:hypothetical protein
MTELAGHLIDMLAAGDRERLERAFAVVERWHVEGDAEVKEIAAIGLLEDLQNGNLHEMDYRKRHRSMYPSLGKQTKPKDFEPFLLPRSLEWWRKVERFWSKGEIIREDRP